MLIIFQFPISDARIFHSDLDLRLKVPDWPNPTTEIKPQFVHYFGRAVERRREVDQALPDEIKFCLAGRAVRFNDLSRHHAGLTGARFVPQCAFRRLFCDGQSVVRVEIGIAHHPQQPKLLDLDAEHVLSIGRDLCNLPTVVPQIGTTPSQNKLLRQGPALAGLYAHATLGLLNKSKAAQAVSLVEAGNPLLVIELERHEASISLTPEGFTHVPHENTLEVNLAFGRVKTSGGIVSTWIIQRSRSTMESARRLRLCLMRLHAEQESLDLVLKQIWRKNLLNPPEPSVIEDLDDYLNKKTSLINRDMWGGIRQSAILNAFDAVNAVTSPATRSNLVQRYEGARRQIWKKVDDYQKRRAAIRVVPVVTIEKGGIIVEQKSVSIGSVTGSGNVFNIGEFMSQVTNNVNNNLEQSATAEEIKTLLKQLTTQITTLAPQAEPKQIQRMGKDLETLASEVAQPEPRKEWYSLSLKGIKEAAEAVGSIAMPVIETVKKLMPLLLGV